MNAVDVGFRRASAATSGQRQTSQVTQPVKVARMATSPITSHRRKGRRRLEGIARGYRACLPSTQRGRYDAAPMSFFRRHRVPVVLVGLAVVVLVLVGYRIKKQQASAVPRRQLEIVVGVVTPIVKDLDVKLAYTADVS